MLLSRDQTRSKKPVVSDRVIAVRGLSLDDKTRLITALGAYLRDRSPRVRESALRVVCENNLRELEDQTVVLLSDTNMFVRNLAIECLGEFHFDERNEMPFLYPFLDASESLTRVETLETLAYIGDTQALPLIAKCLEDDDYLVRSYAALSIAELGGMRYRPRIAAIAKSEPVEKAKPWFARALFMLGDEEQFSILIDLLLSTNCTARCAAANALAELDLSAEQEAKTLAAVSGALSNFLARSDQSTMQQVQNIFLERFEGAKN